ncbi:MAG: hypothetical protein HYS77_03025 [Candidatus Rokubacteria bacterium]|nr:hypothetical protein [Candidatus Rokubacteria bacterium]
MPSEASPDVAFAGRRLKRKVLLALALSSVLPLLVLTYVVHGFVLPALHASETVAFYGLTCSSPWSSSWRWPSSSCSS